MTICSCCRDEEPCAAQITIFEHLDRESQQRISNIAVHRYFHKGETVFTPDNTGLYLISKGRVKVYSLTPGGKELLLRVLNKGDFVGEDMLFGAKNSVTYGEALTELSACYIGRDDFLNLLMQYPSISLKLLEEFNARLIRADQQASVNLTQPVMARMAGYFLELAAAQDSDEIRLPITMKELAAFLNTTPETVSRRLAAMEQEGLITRHGKRIQIRSWSGLKAQTEN